MPKKLNSKSKVSNPVLANVTVILSGGHDNPHELGVYHLEAMVNVTGTVSNHKELKVKTLMAAYGVNRAAATSMLSAKNLFDFAVFMGHITAIG